MRAATSIEFRNDVYVPLGSMFMLVERGQFWVVAGCSGEGIERATTIYSHEIEISSGG